MHLQPVSWALGQTLYLVHHPLTSDLAAPPAKPEPVHHILVIDCSGSMASELPLIRDQLKAKLPSLLAEHDTITIVWFSGRGECGVIVPTTTVDLRMLADINRNLDRWLRPVGMTGFFDPLTLVEINVRAIQSAYGSTARIALFFMSDGWDNCSHREDVLRLVATLSSSLASATMVEYGYYADHALLTRMAEKAGGSVVLAADFRAYAPTFETALRRTVGSPKKQDVLVPNEPVGGILFALDGGEVLTFATGELSKAPSRAKVGWTASVPAHTPEIFYLSDKPVGQVLSYGDVAKAVLVAKQNISAPFMAAWAALYASVSLFAQRIQPKRVWELLRALGDVRLIDEFAVCFGKQRYGSFVATAKAAAFGDGRMVRGYDPARAPAEDAFTVLDLFDLLAASEGCRVLTESDAWSYSRIGRKAVDKGEMLTVKEGHEVEQLLAEMTTAVPAREVAPLVTALDKLDAVLRHRKKALRFDLDAAGMAAGYGLESLVWNETMPNLSFRVRQVGTVDLSGVDLPAEIRSVVPAVVRTYRYRTYTVVKDGLVHLDALPVVTPRPVFDTLVAVGAFDPATEPFFEEAGGIRYVIDLKKIPVINQKMVNDVSARDLADKAWRLLQLKAAAKVWKYYAPERESTGFAKVYGAPAAAWLEEHGITDHSGFKVETTAAPPVDFYVGRALDVKIPGFSSFPKVEEARERMEAEEAAAAPGAAKPKGKPKTLNAPGRLMVPALREVDAFRASDVYQQAADKDGLFARWVDDKAKATVAATRRAQTDIAKVRWSILVGGTWLFPTFDEKSLKIDLGGESREVTFDLDPAVKIFQ